MPLSRVEKEEFVRDLYYNKRKSYHEIAKVARISLRDIKGMLNDGTQGAWGNQSMSKESLAYKMFYEGKSPIDVAVALNLREPEVTDLYKECWNLKQLYDLNQMYLETKGHIAPIVDLYKSLKARGMDVRDVVRYLKLANDLPGLEKEYERLKEGINSLEEQCRNSDRKLVELNNQITESSNYVEYYRALCRQEATKMNALQQEHMKREAIVKDFENNNEGYLKIRESVEEKVRNILSNSKGLLRYALLSLVESIKKDPEKYSSLIYNGIYSPSTSGYASHYYPAVGIYGQPKQSPSQGYYSADCLDMIIEEAEKLHDRFAKEWAECSIDDYANRVT